MTAAGATVTSGSVVGVGQSSCHRCALASWTVGRAPACACVPGSPHPPLASAHPHYMNVRRTRGTGRCQHHSPTSPATRALSRRATSPRHRHSPAAPAYPCWEQWRRRGGAGSDDRGPRHGGVDGVHVRTALCGACRARVGGHIAPAAAPLRHADLDAARVRPPALPPATQPQPDHPSMCARPTASNPPQSASQALPRAPMHPPQTQTTVCCAGTAMT